MKLLRALVALASLAPLAACASGTPPREEIVVAASAAPAGLDFTTVGGAATPQALMGNVFETLVRIDDAGTPQPFLADSWEVDDAHTTYTFHLRDDVTFSNGKTFDAQDAKFSIEYVRDGWTNAIKKQMAPVDDVTVVDPLTLRVRLSHPAPDWLWSMGTFTGAMMTPESLETRTTAPLGTGPYTVRVFRPGEAIEFSARPDYWAGEVDHDATLRYFADAVSAVNALRIGDVDAVWEMQAPQLVDALPADITVDVGTTNGEVIFSMNNNVAPFDDVDVRKAAAYAIDREALNQVVYSGLGTDTGGAPVPPTDPWYPDKNYYPFDPDAARALLAGRTPELTITVPSRPYAQAAAELIYSQLRDVGFDVRLSTVEFPAVWLAEVLKGHNYQASIVSHVEPRDIPMLFGTPDYYLGYDSQAARELIAAGDMRGAVDQIMADAAALTLVNAPNIVLLAPGVTGLDPNIVTDSLPLAPIRRHAQ